MSASAPSVHHDVNIIYTGQRFLQDFHPTRWELGAIAFFVRQAAEKEGATVDGSMKGKGLDL